jgi:hypothetical protein
MTSGVQSAAFSACGAVRRFHHSVSSPTGPLRKAMTMTTKDGARHSGKARRTQ